MVNRVLRYHLDEYTTYTLQIPVNHVTGMEVVETLSYIQQLEGI